MESTTLLAGQKMESSPFFAEYGMLSYVYMPHVDGGRVGV